MPLMRDLPVPAGPPPCPLGLCGGAGTYRANEPRWGRDRFGYSAHVVACPCPAGQAVVAEHGAALCWCGQAHDSAAAGGAQ